MIKQYCSGSGWNCDNRSTINLLWLDQIPDGGRNEWLILRARWGFIFGNLYFLPEGKRLPWSCKKRVGTYFVAICCDLDLYNCSRLVSGVHNTPILQEMLYVLFTLPLFLIETFPHQETKPKVITFKQMNYGRQTCFCLFATIKRVN